jgi:multidrug efflux pump subunit AcrB
VLFLFDGLRQPIIIFMLIPLSLIGVSAGLLIMNTAFGFMALLGFLSLSGMLIKNAIVLLDEVEVQRGEGETQLVAILNAATSRARPVSMAALTTVLGMLPLIPDLFFVGLAVTVMFGLAVATVLTLVVVPVFYAIFFKIPASSCTAANYEAALSSKG